MSTTGQPASLFQSYPLGEPQPDSVFYHGLEYAGPAVREDRWDPEWGRPLEGDLYFRIVFLRQQPHEASLDIQDSRVAVCVPGRRPSRGRGQVGKELAAIRETQALYLTRRDPETALIRGYLERQLEDAEGRLVMEEAARYTSGSIESPTVFSQDIDWYFAGPEPSDWIQRLASALLSWSYPSVPVEPSLFPRPLTPVDVTRIYEAIFPSTVEGRSALGEFGPGLGLSKPDAPLTFDPGESQVFQEIRARLEVSRGQLSSADIHPLLAHALGLTRPLANLYLLAFTYYGQPETELRLAPDHGLTFRDGRPVRGRSLTRGFIPLLPWRDDYFDRKFVSLNLPGEEVSWNDALQYASLLCQGLTELDEGSPDVSTQERELLDSLGELVAEVKGATGVLESLTRAILTPNAEELRSGLRRLSEVGEAGNFQEVHERAIAAYPGPIQLVHELDQLRQLNDLGGSVEEIIEMKDYLDGGNVVEGYPQLVVDRTALLEEMSLPVLLATSRGWSVVRGHVRDYQARYRRAYVAHHGEYQGQVSSLLVPLEDCRRKLHALTLLNSIGELGQPVGPELVQRYMDLEPRIRVCDVDPTNLLLGVSPRCETCQVVLGERPPTQELELFLRGLNSGLGEQNGRLSRVLVERILRDQADQHLENFLKIVQASDLSALSNTLNYELAQFIQQFLRAQ